MTARLLSLAQTLAAALKPGRASVIAAVELAGIAAICYGISGWTVSGAIAAGGAALILEAYSLERR